MKKWVKILIAVVVILLMLLWGYHVAFQNYMSGWLH